jgi:transposase-like protein
MIEIFWVIFWIIVTFIILIFILAFSPEVCLHCGTKAGTKEMEKYNKNSKWICPQCKKTNKDDW